MKKVKAPAPRANWTLKPRAERTYRCPYCNDSGVIYYVHTVEGEQIQLPPSTWIRDALREHPGSRDYAETCNCQSVLATSNRLQKLLESGGVPERFHGFTFATWDSLGNLTDGKQLMAKRCRQFADGKLTPTVDDKLALVLSGPVGTGKTGLASCVLMERARRGQNVLWIDYYDFLRRVKSTYDEDSKVSLDQIVKAAATVAFLLIDDLGDADRDRNAPVTEHTRELMYQVLNARYNNLRQTIITTNLTQAAFKAQFGERIEDRVNHMALWLDAGGANIRRANQ